MRMYVNVIVHEACEWLLVYIVNIYMYNIHYTGLAIKPNSNTCTVKACFPFIIIKV